MVLRIYLVSVLITLMSKEVMSFVLLEFCLPGMKSLAPYKTVQRTSSSGSHSLVPVANRHEGCFHELRAALEPGERPSRVCAGPC